MGRKNKFEPTLKTFYAVLLFGHKHFHKEGIVDWNGWIEIRAFNHADAKQKLIDQKIKFQRIYKNDQFTDPVMQHFPKQCQMTL